MQIPLGDTYYTKFTTRSFSTGAPTTLAGTPVISAYEENNLTQITAGITLTVDYDSVTGMNDIAVVATSGNGYEVGKYYDLVITTGTVGGVSVVGEVVGHFRAMAAETVAGVPEVDVTFVSGTAQTANDNGADINAILTDTADMQPRVAAIEVDTSTTLQAELDAIQAAVITNAAGVDIAADIIAIKAETALIVADTNELQTDDIPGVIAALNNLSAADVLTTQLTESYAADGAAPTLTQSLMLIQQMLGDFSISGTTLTVKKVDGSTSAATFTLNDASTPTSITRAT